MRLRDLPHSGHPIRASVRLASLCALLLGLVFLSWVSRSEAVIEDFSRDLFFSGVPPLLSLTDAPTASVPHVIDSGPLTSAGGNPWLPLGVWSGSYDDERLLYQTTSRFVSASIFVALQSPADTPSKIDLRVELDSLGSLPIALAFRQCVELSNDIVEIAIPLDGDTYVGAGGLAPIPINVTVSVRLGTDPGDASCGAPATLAGVRFFYDSAPTLSRVTRQIHREPVPEQTFALRSLPPPFPDPVGCVVDGQFGCLSPFPGTFSRTLEFGPLKAGGDWLTIGTWREKGNTSPFGDDRLPADVGRAAILGLSELKSLAFVVTTPSDRGTRLDVLADVEAASQDGRLWASTGLVRCTGALSDTEHTHVTVPLSSFQTPIPAGTQLLAVTLTLKARLGTTHTGAPCNSRRFTQAVQLHWGAVDDITQSPEDVQFSFSPTRAGIFLSAGPLATPNLAAFSPTGHTPLIVDSPPIGSLQGNPWRDVGVWSGSVDFAGLEVLPDLSQPVFRIWLGLKNSDDAGTRIDARLVLRGRTASQAFTLSSIDNCRLLLHGTAKASAVEFPLPELLDLLLNPYPQSSLRVDELRISVRMGTAGPSNAPCDTHRSATGARLYFGSSDRPSGIDFIVGQDLD